MMGLLLPLHRFRIWILKNLLAESPYQQVGQGQGRGQEQGQGQGQGQG